VSSIHYFSSSLQNGDNALHIVSSNARANVSIVKVLFQLIAFGDEGVCSLKNKVS
jgi:hypothetical protein